MRQKQFSKSNVTSLVRHRGGNYYASAKVAGKVIRRSLETDDFNVAKNRLPAALAEMKGAKNSATAVSLGIAIQDEAGREDPTIEETTRHYYGQIAIALAKVAARLPDNPLARSIPKVSLADLRALMDKFAATYSVTPYNGGLALLRRTMRGPSRPDMWRPTCRWAGSYFKRSERWRGRGRWNSSECSRNSSTRSFS